jgi:histone-lysine N-methyltransferase SETD3
VFLCYGRHTNLELLRHYGFVLPPGANPHDTALLPPCTLPAAVRQQLGLGDSGGGHGDGGAAPDAYLHASGTPSWKLLRALRLGCASSAVRRTLACRALADRPVSAASEQAAFAALRQACQAALDAFPTSQEQDERQLAALSLPGAGAAARPEAACSACHAGADAASQQQQRRQQQQHVERLCVVLQWRLEQKRILKRGVALCEAVLAAFGDGSSPPAAQLAAVRRATPRW